MSPVEAILNINTYGYDVMLSMEIDGETVYMQKINTISAQSVEYPLTLGLLAERERRLFAMRFVSLADVPFRIENE